MNMTHVSVTMLHWNDTMLSLKLAFFQSVFEKKPRSKVFSPLNRWLRLITGKKKYKIKDE